MVSGTLHYFVNGRTIAMRAGEGLVINSSRLHYSFSPERKEAWFSCAVIGTELFENLTAATHLGRRIPRVWYRTFGVSLGFRRKSLPHHGAFTASWEVMTGHNG